MSPPDVFSASGQAGQGDPPPSVPPVSDPPHLVAEASSGDGLPAPLRTPTRLCQRGTRPPTTPSELLVQVFLDLLLHM
uniref:Uncharacterized protein n=1 Tax=Chromera velia CCMP2878 TaxID=1169474 RepID=A0A0G4HQS7_9ALVE|eukprot:Cvel_1253.t1-p1 / transcript=Cvel_1253.t1 / gene=Cvel_1253 / organism=Chromera_velia_CCMP2878 / gene_product=hypothetical protein / transcript_product=hypothetical protein / location=Cvel_scaffold42:39872-40102(+) / protein_length=77 / sequence_SO=supercontig / SO=protein_coding / is_pseudo=false